MFKKTFAILYFIFYFLFFISPVNAAAEDKTQQIKDQLITNIASHVAQLKLVEKRGIVGTVTEVSNTQITILDVQNNIRFIDVDELTKFTSDSAKGSFGISDLSKDTMIGVLGLYNKESRRILARFVDVMDMPKIIHGKVAFVDGKNFTVDVATTDNKQVSVDVESITKTFSYTKDEGLLQSGFSKIKEGQTIIAIKSTNPKYKDTFVAARIIIFPDFSTISPSTGSGKKLTPIVK